MLTGCAGGAEQGWHVVHSEAVLRKAGVSGVAAGMQACCDGPNAQCSSALCVEKDAGGG